MRIVIGSGLVINMDVNGLMNDRKLKACPECGHTVDYKGLGEYFCSACDKMVYDDYGKVRRFLEEYPGATLIQIAKATGVDKAKIRYMVEQQKFVINGTPGGSLM